MLSFLLKSPSSRKPFSCVGFPSTASKLICKNVFERPLTTTLQQQKCRRMKMLEMQQWCRNRQGFPPVANKKLMTRMMREWMLATQWSSTNRLGFPPFPTLQRRCRQKQLTTTMRRELPAMTTLALHHQKHHHLLQATLYHLPVIIMG